MRFLLLFLISFPAMAESSKILCELDGTYSVTYKDIKKTYLSEGIELFKNLARQTQQSLFLLQRAKTNFAEEDWQKDKMYVVQYWDVDTRKESFKSLKHTLDPSPAWINSNADWESTKTDTGITVTHTMNTGDVHPLFPDYEVDIYSISNSFNWFTGKGQISGDIWLNKKDGTKNRNPKIEIMAAGKCQPQKKKF
ncbi:hypothetical protein N9I79_03390 [Gammaproteobacteria bacterium]|nr:hypothetical protein [Gammaproteobacteria bacterium]MDA8808599.1 hypothetical protein [Gammaproteobacteria bacterium]MDA8929189.1 hypothetical protein [Gammaproteobacteria bacterium]MDA9040276.1 hypothetical protein [Gammaproteobacteria bacterium]MDA9957422.1 hypothetical protein [Gammaproteobacteria bacterium]|tara:strand:- start:126 stop:710 length:585 start_codon:yes stop_codon:yes gene_type:complete